MLTTVPSADGSPTVIDDGAIDLLSGEAGLDWFFSGSLDGLADIVADLTSREENSLL